MKRISAFLVLVIAMFTMHSQESPLPSGTGKSLVYFKPSFALVNMKFEAQTGYEDQLKSLLSRYLMDNCATEVYLDPLRVGMGWSYKRDTFTYRSFLRQMRGITYIPKMGISWDRIEIQESVRFRFPRKSLNREKFRDGES